MKRSLSCPLLLITVSLLASCANRVIPTGGVKDLAPPVVVLENPSQRTTDFQANKIELRFNKYVQLIDLNKQLVISPPIKPQPVVEVRNKSVWIRFKGGLAPNTTYNLQFGNAIADNHENTPLAGYRYVFSTGQTIDSAFVTGRISDALTGTPPKGALAMLYPQNTPDSLVYKTPPLYFTRSDSTGMYFIRNVHPGTYRITGLMDLNNNYVADQPEENVGFRSSDLSLNDSAEVDIRLSAALPPKITIRTALYESPGKLTTVFSNSVPASSYRFTGTPPAEVRTMHSEYSDTVTIWALPGIQEPVSLVWDLNGSMPDTVIYQLQRGVKEDKNKKQDFVTGIPFPSANGKLPSGRMPFIGWAAPIVQFDTSRITVLRDSAATAFTCTFTDSMRINLRIQVTPAEGQYRMQLLPGAVRDIYARSNDTLQAGFYIPAERTTGSIALDFRTSKPGPMLIQLVNDKGEIVDLRQATTALKTGFSGIEPGTYRLRAVADENNNGRWDPGDFSRRIQPEATSYYHDQVVVRSNWEIEIEWKD